MPSRSHKGDTLRRRDRDFAVVDDTPDTEPLIQHCGAASYERLRETIRAAAADPYARELRPFERAAMVFELLRGRR